MEAPLNAGEKSNPLLTQWCNAPKADGNAGIWLHMDLFGGRFNLYVRQMDTESK
jgi:hypothetical protein